MKQWRDAGNILLLRNDFKIDQYVLVLVRKFIILFEIREEYFSLLVSIKDLIHFGDIHVQLY